MKTVVIDRFEKGIADDRLAPAEGEFGYAKHFDILTNPRRLQPMRGMTAHTTSTGIGNLAPTSDGFMVGIGENAASPGNGKLWKLAGYGASDDFGAFSTNQTTTGLVYDFLLDWPEAGNVRTIHWAGTNLLIATKPAGDIGLSSTALTYTTIGQGLVHPKDKYLYFPYRNSSAGYVGVIVPNATPFSGLNATAFQTSFQYRAYCLSHYGDYLAVPLAAVNTVSLPTNSYVGLWDRDTSNTLFSETINWGNGRLLVLNNVGGALVGVSQLGDDSLQAGTAQDYNSIQIKVWAGGSEPTLIKELKAIGLSGASGKPSVTLQTRVNFVYNNRLYFSAKFDPNDGIQPSRVGLFSVGRNKYGQWTVQHERMATNDGSETSILAAAMVGDYLEVVHDSVGTLKKSINGNPSSSTYAATSVYESGVNPQMSPTEAFKKKDLLAFGVTFEPLPSSATVVLKYRTDSKGNDANWVTVKTFSTAGSTGGVATDAGGETFVPGRNFEFRLESTGGAVITSFAYRYKETTEENI